MDAPGRLGPRAELRAGDADRQAVAAELQRHFVDGRLNADEFDERVAQALEARTFGELALPLGDLPVLPSPGALEREHALPPRGDWCRFTSGTALGALMIAIGVLALLWMFALPTLHWGGLPFWPIFFAAFFFIGGRPRRWGRRDRWQRGGPPTRYL